MTFLIGMVIAIILPIVLTLIFSIFAERKNKEVVREIE
jgi:PTS system trehalose-specific IIC component